MFPPLASLSSSPHDQVTSTLTSERDSNKVAIGQLHSQINVLQADLTKSQTLVESLKSAKRILEQSQSDAETHLRRAEAALADVNEKADQHAEEVVLLKQELEDVLTQRNESESRMRTEIKELKDEIQHLRRTASASAAAAADAVASASSLTTDADAPAATSDSSSIDALKEELTILQEEKTNLMQDVEDMTTDLTKAQEENDELTQKVEELEAKLAAAAVTTVSSASSQPLPPTAEQIEGSSIVRELRSKITALESELTQSTQLTTTQSNELATIKREFADVTARLAAAESTSATTIGERDQRLAELEQKLSDSQQVGDELSRQLARLDRSKTDLESALATLESSVAPLRSQLDDARADATRRSDELATLRAAHETALAASHATHATALADLHSRLTATTQELTLLRASSSDADSATSTLVTSLRHELVQSKEREATAYRRVTELESKLATAQTEFDARHSQLDDAHRVERAQLVSTHASELEAVRAQVTVAREEVTEARHKCDELAATHRDTERRLAVLERELESVRSERAAFETQLAAALATNATLEQRVQEASSTATTETTTTTTLVTELENEIETLRGQLADAEATCTQLATQLEEQQQQQHRHEEADKTENESAPSSSDALSDTATATVAPAPTPSLDELSTLREENISLVAQVAELTDQLAALSDQSLEWDVDKRALVREVEQLRRDLIALQQQQQEEEGQEQPEQEHEHEHEHEHDDSTSSVSHLNGTDVSHQSSSTPIVASPSQSPNSSFVLDTTASPTPFTLNASSASLSSSSFSTALTSSSSVAAGTTAASSTFPDVHQLESQLRHDLDGLRAEVSKLDDGTMAPVVASLQTDIGASVELMASLRRNLVASTDRELELMARLQHLTGTNIRVFCRVRPLLPHEQAEVTGAKEENLLQYPNEQQISIRVDVARRNRTKLAEIPSAVVVGSSSAPSTPAATAAGDDDDTSLGVGVTPAVYTPFNFDKVFMPDATQAQVYESVEEMVLPVLNGFKACIFAVSERRESANCAVGTN